MESNEQNKSASTGGLSTEIIDSDESLSNPEPWEPWESKLVLYSLGIGFVALVILGVIVNMTILNQ